MPEVLLPPPLSAPGRVADDLRTRGFAVLDAATVCALSGVGAPALAQWATDWDLLPPDRYLRDGGRYRRRRHSCFVVRADTVQAVPHRAHWQPLDYNALHGGLERWFEPMLHGTASQPDWLALLVWLGRVTSALRGERPWYVEAHQFRIDTTDGIGRPTPEGAHRDGVDLVAVFLVSRAQVKGGETRVFEADGPAGQRFTLAEPWSLLLLDDARVIHETTPIQPLSPGGHRDTLVITLRAEAFQAAGPAADAPS
jgi:hypothetical protein